MSGFGDSKLDGEVIGNVESANKWQFEGMGYHTKGYWMIEGDKPSEITIVPLAIRQCKELGYKDSQGKWTETVHRYHPKESPKNMVKWDGDTRSRIQVLAIVNGELKLWGSSGYTVRWFWINPKNGKWNNADFELGYIERLEQFRKEQKELHGRDSSTLYWQSVLKADSELTDVGYGNNTSYAKRVLSVGEPSYVGDDKVLEYSEFYNTEDLAGWIAEWENAETSVVENEAPVDPADEKGEAPNPAMVTDETELDEVPF